MPFSTRNAARASLGFFLVGFLALTAIVGISIWLSERARVYYAQTLVDRGIRLAAVDLRHAVQTAESSQRGYLLTGNQIYLAPYGNAKATSFRELANLKSRLATSADALPALERLSAIVSEKFSEMDDTIAMKRERRDENALAVFRTNRGKALMDEANVFFSGFLRAADERLAVGADEQQANAARLRWLTILGGLIIVAVAGGAAVTTTRNTRGILAAREEVDTLNASLERRVKERTAELAAANDELQRFAYIVTHDLRAPLVNIMGFTSELERGVASMRVVVDRSVVAGTEPDAATIEARLAADEDLPEAIGFIRSSTKKMDSLINAILKLSREGRRTLRPEPISLRGLVETCADAVQHQLAEASGSIDVAELAVDTITTDRMALEQIIGNLLDNAIKYRSPHRPLAVAIRVRSAPAGRLTIEVSDNGRGIAEGDRERIFELFRRAGALDQPGEGIGLAHVRALVRHLGGDIAMTSQLGEGTTFRINLPKVTPKEALVAA
jgi:signal transduction histidine kinase